jgi:tRNA dimethylallyltransferase
VTPEADVTSGVLIVTGPTASGKSALALELAQRFDAEIVGADSRQIYRGMAIGTAAPSEAERARVRHHLVGFLDPHERYSAARFVADALRAIDEIHARGKRALIAGGTGFYVRALTGDVALSPLRDDTLRERLAREALVHPPDALAEWLRALAPERAAALAPNDPYRITRALEIVLAERSAKAQARSAPGDGRAENLRTRRVSYCKLYLEIAPDVLRARIAARVDTMLRTGLLEEAERIGPGAVAADAVGYREALAYLSGWSTYEELRALLERTTRRYAKRQATWFRTEPDVVRIPAERAEEHVLSLVQDLGWDEAR